jgi:predicted phosphodiesterase
MQLFERRLPSKHRLLVATCIHQGTLFQHSDGVKQLIEETKEDNTYLALLGDLAEAIAPDDPRFSFDSVDPKQSTAVLQYKSLVKQFEPVKERVLFSLTGNHDMTIARKSGNLVEHLFCSQLNIPFGTYTCKTGIFDTNGNRMYKIFATHGFGQINSTLPDIRDRRRSMERALVRKLMPKAADCELNVMGHTHKLIVVKPEKELYLTDNGAVPKQHYTSERWGLPYEGRYIPPNDRWYANCGSFLKLYGPMGASGYAEIAGLDPIELGYVLVMVEDGRIQNVEPRVL